MIQSLNKGHSFNYAIQQYTNHMWKTQHIDVER